MVLNEETMGPIDQRTREGLFYEENSAEDPNFSGTHAIIAIHYQRADYELNTPIGLWYGQGTYGQDELRKKSYEFEKDEIAIRESLLPDYLDVQVVYAAGLINASVPEFYIDRNSHREWHQGIATGLYQLDENGKEITGPDATKFGKKLRRSGAIVLASAILAENTGNDRLKQIFNQRMEEYKQHSAEAYIMSELMRMVGVSDFETLYMAESSEEGRANYIEFDKRFRKDITNGVSLKSFLQTASQVKTVDRAKKFCRAMLSKIK